MVYFTDFADGAVMLPVACLVALILGVCGWWRGLAAWAGTVGGTLSAVAVLKAAGVAVDPFQPVSVSGHVAAACMIYGGIAVLLLRGRLPPFLLAVIPAALAAAVGYSRIALLAHSPAEVAAGAAIGCGGVVILAVAAGPRTAMPAWPVMAGVACTALACHGLHLQSEVAIDALFAAR